jgi:hypothetical protein
MDTAFRGNVVDAYRLAGLVVWDTKEPSIYRGFSEGRVEKEGEEQFCNAS